MGKKSLAEIEEEVKGPVESSVIQTVGGYIAPDF